MKLHHKIIATTLACLLVSCSRTNDPNVLEKPDKPPGHDKTVFVCCDDGVFCNGAETCSEGDCFPGISPCVGDQVCDEELKQCIASPPPPECTTNADCDDGLFCNGPEGCVAGNCMPGAPPCSVGETCDEGEDACIAPPPPPECTTNSDCDDGMFCNGAEECVSGMCMPGADPCEAGETCNEAEDVCIAPPPPPECTTNSDCDDGLNCNGHEMCVGGNCIPGSNPCSEGQTCDETDGCITPPPSPECTTNSDCDDIMFCNGVETCVSGTCMSGAPPCSAVETCDELFNECVSPLPPDCVTNVDCSDGMFCNGSEACVGGTCMPGANPCSAGETCDEAIDQCVAVPPPPSPSGFEGFGKISVGGAGGETYSVTSLANSGAGTLRDAIANRNFNGGAVVPRTIVFDVGGTITWQTDVSLNQSFLTIDGSTAPSPGITVRKPNLRDGELIISSSQRGVHDLIITHIRFRGNWPGTELSGENNAATLVIDGEDHPDGVYNIVLDHIVSKHGTDSAPDLWGNIHDVTISWSIFSNSQHPMTISHIGGIQARERISIHHNIFGLNHERNPQIRGNVQDFDYVNNVVYNWGVLGSGGYGVRIRDRNGVRPTRLNFINNFFSSNSRQDGALIYGSNPGAGDDAGAVDQIWVAGNIFPPQNIDGASTVGAPIPIPAEFQVTTFAVNQLATSMVPNVGMGWDDAEEQALKLAVMVAMGGTPPPPLPECTTNADCVDTLFCNGTETCFSQTCMPGMNPCLSGEVCDEAMDQCVAPTPDCVQDSDCSDGFFCNGTETCVNGSCLAGTNPCPPDQVCREMTDQCEIRTGWNPPIGIPVPSFGIDETHMMYAGQPGYSDAGNGPYTHYVDNAGACSDNGNGSPANPRCSVPDTLGPGSVVEVHGGPYTAGNTVYSWVVNGTASQPVFVRGVDASNPPALRLKRLKVTAQYFVLENFEFDLSEVQILTSRFFSFRYNDIHGRDTGAAISNQGGDDVVIYSNEIHDTGITSTRADRHGFFTGVGTERIWVVDNRIYNNQGDGIQFCHNCGIPAPRFVYIGRNHFYNDEENAIDIKSGSDVIISQNLIHSYIPSGDSGGEAVRINDEGVQNNIWFIYNEVYDANVCIAPWGADFRPYIVGNLIHDCGKGIDAHGSWVTNNIVYDVGSGINDADHAFNNIISNVTGSHIDRGSDNHDNILWQNGNPTRVTNTTCNNCPVVDPLLVIVGGTVTDVAAGSPAIDSGLDVPDVYDVFMDLYGINIRVDRNGVSRPQGTGFDIGAFEK